MWGHLWYRKAHRQCGFVVLLPNEFASFGACRADVRCLDLDAGFSWQLNPGNGPVLVWDFGRVIEKAVC